MVVQPVEAAIPLCMAGPCWLPLRSIRTTTNATTTTNAMPSPFTQRGMAGASPGTGERGD